MSLQNIYKILDKIAQLILKRNCEFIKKVIVVSTEVLRQTF